MRYYVRFQEVLTKGNWPETDAERAMPMPSDFEGFAIFVNILQVQCFVRAAAEFQVAKGDRLQGGQPNAIRSRVPASDKW